MKVVVFTILCLLFTVSGNLVVAQDISPDKQCKILIKKRQGKFKRSVSRRPRVKKIRNDKPFKMAETESAVASAPVKKSKKSAKKATEEVGLAGANVIIFNSMQMPSDDEMADIRSEVTELIANKKDGAPLKLDPLLFKDNNGQLEITNMRPFLMAVEFGRQGRIIIIDGHLGSPQSSNDRMERVKQLMVNMGVEESLLSITGNRPLASNDAVPRIDFTVF